MGKDEKRGSEKRKTTYLHVTLGHIDGGHSGVGGTASQNTTE